MLYSRSLKPVFSVTLSLILIVGWILPPIPAYAVEAQETTAVESSIDWFQVDQSLIDALRTVHDRTEEFAAYELDQWIDSIMERVDERFLDWYFSYINQKAMEFGIPFAWLFFAGDYALNRFREGENQKAKPNQILQQKIIENFQQKFSELVVTPEAAQEHLSTLIERVARNYTSALGIKFAHVRDEYNIGERDWERHLNDLATVVYDTGTSTSNLSPEYLSSELVVVTTAAIGAKVALSFASKATAKIAAKAGGAVAAKGIAQLIDPLVGIGIVLWDIQDYKRMVQDSRPVVRQNILDYLNEVKWSILYSPENGIMTAIEEIEARIINSLVVSRELGE